MGVIYKKELKGYFTGMMGYVFIAFALAVIGIYTVAVNFIQSYPNFEYVLDSIRFLFLLLIPILTMRTMSDEKRQRTDLLLYSSPISTYSIILGKFFAALTVFAVPFAVSCFYPLIIGRYGVVNYKVAYSAIFGFLLMGGACIAIGIFLSSLTESQIKSNVRTSQIALARQIAMYLSRQLLSLPYQVIGRSFSKDHTTVLSNINKIEKNLKTDGGLRKAVDTLTETIKKDD